MEERGDGELELAGVRAGGGGILEIWSSEVAREGGDWNAGVPLVLKRTREGKPELFPKLATAAARWRPWSTTGVAWQERGRSSARGKGRRGARARRVEGHGKQEVACGPPERRRRRSAPAVEESRERERGGR